MNSKLICKQMKEIYCDGCDLIGECRPNYDCATRMLMNEILALEDGDIQGFVNEGCHLCNNKKHKDIFYDDGRGGFRVADFCPACGKKIS